MSIGKKTNEKRKAYCNFVPLKQELKELFTKKSKKMKTENTQTKLTFDQVPEAVAYLVDEVTKIKELVRLQVHHEPEKRLPISIQKASKLIGKAIQTIYGLVSAKQIPYYKQGKQLYFYEDELLEWIQSGKNGGTPNPES